MAQANTKQGILSPSALSAPLRIMRIRWDGVQVKRGGMSTLDSPRFGLTRNGGSRSHQGIDLEAFIGTPVYAIADGVIESVRLSDPNYGVDVLLKFRPMDGWAKHLAAGGNADDDGILYAQYAHLSSVIVKQGQSVRRGELLARTGISGNADQRYPHLHFEIRKVRWPGSGVNGLHNRVDPEVIFKVDYIKPLEALDRASRTV